MAKLMGLKIGHRPSVSWCSIWL